MSRIAVTGTGIVSPAGIGREAFAESVAGGKPAGPPFRVPDFPLDRYLENARPFRRVADATKFALAAASLALSDAGLPGNAAATGRAGLVVAVTHGAITFSTRYHAGLLLEGPAGASPLYFSESVLNAPAGNASIAFGIRGPVHTIVGEETVGAQAIALAASLLRAGAVDRVLVVGTEEWNEVVEGAYGRVDRAAAGGGRRGPSPVLADGAAALLLELESAAAARGARPRARLAGWSIGRFRSGPAASAEVAEVIRAASREAGSPAGEVGHVVLPTGRGRAFAEAGAHEFLGARAIPPRRIDIAPLVGNPVGAACLIQAAASVAALDPDGAGRGTGLVLSTGIEGTVSALLVAGPGKAAG